MSKLCCLRIISLLESNKGIEIQKYQKCVVSALAFDEFVVNFGILRSVNLLKY